MGAVRIINIIRDNAAHIRRASENGVIVTLGLLVMRLSAFILSVIVARIAGVETLGEFTLFITVFILAAEIPRAFDTSYLRATGNNNQTSDKYTFEQVNIAAKLTFILCVGAILFIFSGWIASWLRNPAAGRIIVWALVCGGLNSIYMLLPAIAQQRRDHRAVAMLKPVFNILVLVLVCGALLAGESLSIELIYGIYFLAGLVLALYTIVEVFRKSPAGSINRNIIKAYMHVSLILIISSALTLVGNRLDVFLIGHYLDFTQLGVYGAALRISIVVSVLTGMISIVMMPRAAEASADPEKFKRYLALGGFYNIIQLGLGIVLLSLLKPIITMTYGADYAEASIPSALLIIQVLLTAIAMPFQVLLQCGEKPSTMVYISLARILISLPLLLTLIPRYSVTGAAAAITITTFFISLLIAWQAMRLRPVHH